MRKTYDSEEERLKDTFDIDITKGPFADWAAGLSTTARSHISTHDLAKLEKAFFDVQIRIAQQVENTIAYRLYDENDLRMMFYAGAREFPWQKKVK